MIRSTLGLMAASAALAAHTPLSPGLGKATSYGGGEKTLHALHKRIGQRVYGASVPGSVRRRLAREAASK